MCRTFRGEDFSRRVLVTTRAFLLRKARCNPLPTTGGTFHLSARIKPHPSVTRADTFYGDILNWKNSLTGSFMKSKAYSFLPLSEKEERRDRLLLSEEKHLRCTLQKYREGFLFVIVQNNDSNASLKQKSFLLSCFINFINSDFILAI